MADTEETGYVWATPRTLKLLEREMLSRWFDAGVEKKASHLLVLEAEGGAAEPLYVYPAEEGMKVGGVSAVALGDPDHSLYSRWRARTVLEVYHLGMDKALQIETHSKQKPFTLHIPEATARPTLPKEADFDLMLPAVTRMVPRRRPRTLEELSEKDLKTLETHVETASVALRYRKGTASTTWSKDTSKALLNIYELLLSVVPEG